ncbi:DUF3159 domain-containing protein [Promicromonospora iranensis]|uniref:DUF3159 domain-containing protein n=1 Tax=Promicromonospora iranensis TaxID=1105144 RepID=A0ABU2CV72_9MICO|nr:DUF3159 domain-containing protein [Promicromonospora iranensis]MDR7385186.1 hypothetical protein [Promicromonospora iranensis]
MSEPARPDVSPQPEQQPDQAPAQAPARGVRALAGEEFSAAQAIGGVRGLVEAVLPGLVFVVAFVISTPNLVIPLVASVVSALVLVVARLVQRTPVTQALGGLLGIAIGVVWAWTSGEAENYYAGGLLVNAGYLVVLLGSILIRRPAVGYVVEALRAGLTPETVKAQAGRSADEEAKRDDEPSPFAALTAWRDDPAKMRTYAIATWLWVGLFALRLAVKTPLYFAGDIAWLGTFHLLLGVPLWALVLYLTWYVVRRPKVQSPA